MFAPKFLLTGIGLVAACGTVAAFKSELFSTNKVLKNEKKKQFIVAVKNANNKTAISSSLIETGNTNYICKVGTEKIDNCKIYKLNRVGGEASSKEIQNILLNDKEDIVDGENFVIEIPEKYSLNISGDSTISVSSKEGNPYFDLSFISENFDKQKTLGFKSQTVIAKIKSISNSISSSTHKTPYKCHLSTKKNCNIYKLPNNLSIEKTNIPFSNNSVVFEKEITNKSDIVVSEYIAITTEDTNIFAKDWKDSEQKIYLNDLETEFLTIEYVSPIYGDIESIEGMSKIKENKYAYLVVSSSDPTTVTNSKNDFDQNSVKGYKCSVSIAANNVDFDDACQLYKLNSITGSSDLKTLDLHKIISDEENAREKTSPAANKNFVLKISRNLLDRMSNVAESKISLVNKDDVSKKYIELTKLHELTKENNKFKANLILAKVNNKSNSPSITDETVDFKCKFKSSQAVMSDCKVFSFSSRIIDSDTTVKFVDTNIQKINNTNWSSITARTSYVLIQIPESNSFKTEKELRSFIPKIYKSQTDATELLTTKYVDSYVGNINLSTINKSKTFKVQKSPEDYLVVVASFVESNATSAASDPLSDADGKKYKCTSATNLVDDSCLLVPIIETENQSINLTSVSSAAVEITKKTDFTVNKYFKLIVNDPALVSKEFTVNDEIDIVSSKEIGKKYGKVKVVSKFSNDKYVGKSQWFLAKSETAMPSNENSTSITGQQCKFNNSGSFATCDLYKAPTSFDGTNYKTANLSTFSKTSITKADLTTNKYLIIKLDQQKDVEGTVGRKISIKNGSDNDEKAFNFYIASPLHVILGTGNNTILGQPLILSK